MTILSSAIWHIRRLLPRIPVFVLGDGAVLRYGLAGRIGRLLRLPVARHRPHPYALYEPNPGWRSSDGRSRHNSLGFRGADVASAKPNNRFRIVCMGESCTYGGGIDDDDATYPARLAAHLHRARPDLDIEVINAGVGGYTSLENLLRCQFCVVPLLPDLIVYYYTHNDVTPRRAPVLSRDYREYSRAWYEPWLGGGILGWIVRRRAFASGQITRIVRRKNDRRWRHRPLSNVLLNPPHAFRANMTALTLIAQAAGASVLFVQPCYPGLKSISAARMIEEPRSRAVWEHRQIIEDISQTLGASVYDLAKEMPYPDVNQFPTDYYISTAHFNERGADLAAKLIADAIIAERLLEKTRPKRLII